MDSSLSSAEYIGHLYKLVLRRQADPDGLAHWSAMIRETSDPTIVLSALLTSDEYAALAKAAVDTAPPQPETPYQATEPDEGIGIDARQCGVFIPTRDSANYVAIFLDKLRSLGIEPLYIVDGRSQDKTIEILQTMGARCKVVMPHGSFGVTELVEAACRELHADWVMRLDDDELPTRSLISFVTRVTSGSQTGTRAYRFGREWLIKRFEAPYFFRSWVRWDQSTPYDLQTRIFLRSDLQFDHQIHTAGIISDARSAIAPENCFVVHFDTAIKSRSQRLLKMRRYEAIETGSAWKYSDLYLPEAFSDEAFCLHQRGMREFRTFIDALPSLKDEKTDDLRPNEVQRIIDDCPVKEIILT